MGPTYLILRFLPCRRSLHHGRSVRRRLLNKGPLFRMGWQQETTRRERGPLSVETSV